MLIPSDRVKQHLEEHNVHITGVLHIGAHACEELQYYSELGVSPTDIVWIEALPGKVEQAQQRGIPNVYQSVITDKDDSQIKFHITNNIVSSSVLPFGTHAFRHPDVVMIGDMVLNTTTIDTFFSRNKLDSEKYTFWCMDIQGAEMMALKGASKALKNVKALFLEVTIEELYKGCGQIHGLDAFLSEFTRVETYITEFGWGDALYIRTQPPSVEN